MNSNISDRKKQLCTTGYLTFFLSGICAISSGIIVSILQEKYGFSFRLTGTLLSFMSIGNMAASFASGILPGKIGLRNTVLILCSGYLIGYLLMTASGIAALLCFAFLLVGIAKGCALNNCTVLVGENSKDRTKGMSLLHACYACGALFCPFIITFMSGKQINLPMIAIAGTGLLMWLVFVFAKLPQKEAANINKREKTSFDFIREKKFWIITALIFCQNAAETSVTGWLVTYYKNEGILNGTFSAYTVTIMWSATLIARLLIAFVFPIKDTFKALAVMGFGCTLLYGLMIFTAQPFGAIAMLFAFSFAMAGVNPVGIAGVGKQLSTESMGILLPIGSIGAIVMPWLIGIVADSFGLQIGMFCNLIPCAGILVLSLILKKMSN